jgi:putative transposase
LFITPGSPCGNGYCEAVNSKLQDECLKPKIFYSFHEARIIVEIWR